MRWLDLGGGGDKPVLIHLPENNIYRGPGVVSLGSGGAFACQAMAGASLPLHVLPGLQATLEYRFFGTARTELTSNLAVANQTDTINGAAPSAHGRRGFETADNAILIGLR